MRKYIYHMVLFLGLGLGCNALAQTPIIRTLDQEIKTLSLDDKQRLEGFLYGTPALLILEDPPTYAWNTNKAVEVVDITTQDIDQLLDPTYFKDFKSAKVLHLRVESDQNFDFTQEMLKAFTSLEYVLIKLNHEKMLSGIQTRLNAMNLNESWKDVVFLIELNTGNDGEN